MYPKAPIFTSPAFGDAWWTVTIPEGKWICEFYGVSLIISLQSLMFRALRPPFQTYNGTETKRARIDGTWGPQTFRAMWAYAKKINAPAAVLQVLEADARAQRITDQDVRIAIWMLFYQPRPIDLDYGNAQRDVRTDEPLLSLQPINNITLLAGTAPPKYLQRPALPDSAFTTQYLPICTEQSVRDTMTSPPQPAGGINAPLDPPVTAAPSTENGPGASTEASGGPTGAGGTGGSGGAGGPGGGTIGAPVKSTSWLTIGLIALGVGGLGYALFSDNESSRPRRRATER